MTGEAGTKQSVSEGKSAGPLPRCPFCGTAGAAAMTWRLSDWRTGTPGEFPLFLCRHCGLAWTDIPPAVETFERVVPLRVPPGRSRRRERLKRAALASRRGYPVVAQGVFWRMAGAVLARLLPFRLARIPAYIPDGRLLDVGCHAGHYTAAMGALGWHAVGADPALAGGGTTTLPLSAAPAEALPFADAGFDGATAWHVLEHTVSPHHALAEICRVLRPGGRLYLEVPNRQSLQARLFGRYWLHWDPPRHRYHFTAEALRRRLADAGFARVDLHTFPSSVGWGGSLANVLGARTGRRPAWLTGWLSPLCAPLALLETWLDAGGALFAEARAAPAGEIPPAKAPPAHPEMSIVVVTWNCREHLMNCLPALRRAVGSLPAEILVVDNASDDGTIQALAEAAPEVRILSMPFNAGFATAANRGWRTARGEVIWFLNPDTLPAEGTAEALAAALRGHPRAGAVGPLLTDAGGVASPLSARRFPTLRTEVLEKAGLRRLAERTTHMALNRSETVEVPAISGAAMCVRRAALEDIDGFDERFFLYGEDLDLCRRLRAAGWGVYSCGSASVVHIGGGCSSAAAEWAGVQALSGMGLYFRRHHGRLYAAVYRGILAVFSMIKLLVFGLGMCLPNPSLRRQARRKVRLHRRILHMLAGGWAS